jgi:hypothetical protein
MAKHFFSEQELAAVADAQQLWGDDPLPRDVRSVEAIVKVMEWYRRDPNATRDAFVWHLRVALGM